MKEEIEYRVREVTRFIVTRHEFKDDGAGSCSGNCQSFGEFDNELQAYRVAEAMGSSEAATREGELGVAIVFPETRQCAQDAATE